MKKRRHEVVLATKWHPYARTSKAEILKSLEGSLRRLQTDHVDIIQVHQVGKASGGESIERLQNEAVYEAFETARKQGKARFLGVTGHDGDLMNVMSYALKLGKYSTILCRYNFLDYPSEPKLFAHAKKQGLGTLCMKTLAGAKGQNLRPFRKRGTTYKQAALRWVLSNRNLSAALISISDKSQVDEYIKATHKSFSKIDLDLLNAYAARYSDQHCRQCNDCESVCPAGIPIAATLRHRMYDLDYGWHEIARTGYQRLQINTRAANCSSCSAPCLQACKAGLAVKELVQDTNARLA